jgi:hypothetical protein
MLGLGGTARVLVASVACAVGCAANPPREEAPPQPAGSVEPVAVIIESTSNERPQRRTLPPGPLSATKPAPPASALAQPQHDGGVGCEAEKIRASHILVAWGGAMRAPVTEPIASRSKEQAMKRIKEALKKARAGADFAKLAGEYSDDPQAAERGGNLGSFSRTMMVRPFADAAFALCPGQLSDVVETAFGYHIILRTE